MHSPAGPVHNPRVSTAHCPLPQRLCAAIFLLFFCLSGFSATVIFPLHNSQGQPAYLTPITLQPVAFPNVGNSNYTIIGDSLPFTTDQFGMLTVSNLETNFYLVTQIGFTTNTTWFISVPLYGATYTNNQITVAFTNAVNDGTMAYSISAANATFVAQVVPGTSWATNYVNGLQVVTVATNSGSGGSGTNVVNVTAPLTAVTNGATTTVSLTNQYQSASANLTNWSQFATNVLSLFLQAANNLSDVPSPATARANLGLGTAATNAAGAFVGSASGTGTNLTAVGTTKFGAGGSTVANIGFNGNISDGGSSVTFGGTGGGADNTYNTNHSPNGFIGGGSANFTGVSSGDAAILTGTANQNNTTSDGAILSGGHNIINSEFIAGIDSAILSGSGNTLNGTQSIIGGGANNYLGGNNSLMGTPQESVIDDNSVTSSILNGFTNWISNSSDIFITGGGLNSASNDNHVAFLNTSAIKSTGETSKTYIGGSGPATVVTVDSSGNVVTPGSITTPTANNAVANAGTITDTNLTASTAVYADSSKTLQSSTTTPTELAQLHGGYPIPSLIGGSVVTNGDGTVEAVNPSSGALILANAAAYTGLFNSTSGSATPGYNGSPILTNYQYASGTLSTNATNATADWLTPDMQSLILSCPVNLFDSTNRTASIGHVKRIKFYPSGGNNYTISVTNVNWHWPISETGVTNHTVTNGFFGMLTLECDGNSETNVSAVWTDFK